ncbi:hypothetical protein P3W33_15755 [Luteibacter sp. PPL552]
MPNTCAPGHAASHAFPFQEYAMKFELPMIAAFLIASMLLCGYTLAMMA